MKELYTSPEVTLIDFKALENLAADPVSIGGEIVTPDDKIDFTIEF